MIFGEGESRLSESFGEVDGFSAPMLVHTDQGDARVNPGHNYQELKIATVQVNPNLPPLTVPDSVTSWNVWVHAITKDLRSGSARKETRSIKELMVRRAV